MTHQIVEDRKSILRYQTPSQPPPPQPPPVQKANSSSGWGGFRKLFGWGSKEETAPAPNYYPPQVNDLILLFFFLLFLLLFPFKDEYDYEPAPARQPVLMRTGRTHENTNLNVRARQRNDEVNSYGRRLPPPVQNGPSSYGHPRSQYGNGQYSSSRPTAIGRVPVHSTNTRCGECGSIFSSSTSRCCPHCGSRR
mgnify:CR=1 FL=1